MFLSYHSEGFHMGEKVFHLCYIDDLHTTPCSGMLGHRTMPPKEYPVFDLKPLPDDLKYAYIDDKKIYLVIISSKLSGQEEERLLQVLRKHRGAMGYNLDDLKGISSTTCQHAINLEPDAKPVVEHQHRFIPKMKEVVGNEILKLLEAGIIYPIADSRWVSPVHCVPKKGGINVVPNDNDELIPQSVIVGYRMCIDFRKINKVARKDRYPLTFIDQMLERLSKKTHLCFLHGHSGFSQIAVKAQDQEKTTFTCPYGTYAYRRMPFKDACLLFFMVFVKKLRRYLWTISPSMGLPLIIVFTILIKFCIYVKKLIL